MTNEVFTVQAPRWCRVRADSSPDGDLFPLDDDGFLGGEHILAPPGSEATAGLLVAPGDVAREGATVLLGEPGAGKASLPWPPGSRPLFRTHVAPVRNVVLRMGSSRISPASRTSGHPPLRVSCASDSQ